MRRLQLTVMIPLCCLILAACMSNSGTAAISTKDAPAAIGPYSQAITTGKLVFLSGQIPLDPATGQISGSSIEDQTRRVMENLSAVLAANGLTMANVVSTTVYLRDITDFAGMNKVYGTYFTTNPPARATVQVARLPKDVALEISAIAAR